MESKIVYLAQYINKKQNEIGDYINNTILVSDNSVINFLTKILFLIGCFIAFMNSEYQLSCLILFVLGYPFFGYCGLKGMHLKKELLKIQKNNIFGTSLKSFNQRFLNFESIVETEQDVNNLKKIIKGNDIKEKINIITSNKSKKAANYQMFFTVIDNIPKNGISKFSPKDLLSLVKNNFLMAGEPINDGSFITSFSTWKRESSEKKLTERKLLIKNTFYNN